MATIGKSFEVNLNAGKIFLHFPFDHPVGKIESDAFFCSLYFHFSSSKLKKFSFHFFNCPVQFALEKLLFFIGVCKRNRRKYVKKYIHPFFSNTYFKM